MMPANGMTWTVVSSSLLEEGKKNTIDGRLMEDLISIMLPDEQQMRGYIL